MQDHYSGDEYEKSQRSRKEKSLGLLCHKFLARYPCYPSASKNNEICLDEVAEELSKLAPDVYHWIKFMMLKKGLAVCQIEAI